MSEKNSFILFYSYKKQFDLLTNEELGILIRALLEYDENGIVPTFDGILQMAFSFISDKLDILNEKYEKRCEKNAENGKKGGRPKQEKSEKKKTLKTQKAKG